MLVGASGLNTAMDAPAEGARQTIGRQNFGAGSLLWRRRCRAHSAGSSAGHQASQGRDKSVWLCSQGEAIEAVNTAVLRMRGGSSAGNTTFTAISADNSATASTPPPPPLSAPVERHSQPPSTERGVSPAAPGAGGRGGDCPPADRVQGGGGSKGLTFSPYHSVQHALRVLSMCMSSACVPWLLGWV